MDLVARVAARFSAVKTAELGVLGIGETFENELWRIHRYAHAIRVTHLENAGRRGKQCVEFMLHGRGPQESQAMEFMLYAKRKEGLPRMNQAMEEAKQIGFSVEKQSLKGISVKPGNFQKLFVRGAHVTIEADYDGYSIQDINDDDNEPTCLAKGKKSVGQFYRWVKDNGSKLAAMTMHEIMEAMQTEGISYHYYCARD